MKYGTTSGSHSALLSTYWTAEGLMTRALSGDSGRQLRLCGGRIECAGVDESMSERVQRDGGRVVQGQLAHQVGTMFLDRLYAQSQFPGNRFVGLTQGDPCQNLALATGHEPLGGQCPLGCEAT